jgi:hypothetical protein
VLGQLDGDLRRLEGQLARWYDDHT